MENQIPDLSGLVSSSNTDNKELVHLCETYVQKDDPDSTGFVYFSQGFFINMLFLETQNICIGMQNLDNEGVSTFKKLCANVFQRCNIMYKQPQYISFLLSHQEVADDAHFMCLFILLPIILRLRTFKISQ